MICKKSSLFFRGQRSSESLLTNKHRPLLKLFSIAIVVFMISVVSLPTFAQEAFVINDYNIKVTTNTDNSFDITERITVDFSEQRHGIFRAIPVKIGVAKYNISRIKVAGDPFSIEYDPDYRVIKIGDPNSTISGAKTYDISYRLTFGKDNDTAADIVYINLIGTQWDTQINRAHIEFFFPEGVKPVKYNVYSGKYNDSNEKGVTVTENGDRLIIENKEMLDNFEGITLLATFPDNTFKYPLVKTSSMIILVAALLLLLISWLLYRKYGKDEIVSPVVEFYPPDKLSSGSIGYLIDRTVEPIDITSMLLYWASHNHLHFVATGKNDFDIKFNSDLDEDHPLWEQNAFNELKKLIAKNGDTLSKSDLQKDFYKVAEKIRPAIPLYFKNERSLNDKTSVRISGLISFLAAIFTGILTISVVYSSFGVLSMALIAGGITTVIAFVFYGMVNLINNAWYKRSKAAGISLSVILSLFAVLFILIYSALAFAIGTTIQFIAIIPALIIIFIIQTIAVFTMKRSTYGQMILERIIGFKEFLVTAEKERLEALLEGDPEYYYHILPFALVLNVSDIWENKFKGFTMEQPSWYEGTYPGYIYSYAMLTSFAHSTSASMARYTAPPSSGTGAGGFSGGGGGFSGGGGGGGGGGSW